jgi:hypothetical protein
LLIRGVVLLNIVGEKRTEKKRFGIKFVLFLLLDVLTFTTGWDPSSKRTECKRVGPGIKGTLNFLHYAKAVWQDGHETSRSWWRK